MLFLVYKNAWIYFLVIYTMASPVLDSARAPRQEQSQVRHLRRKQPSVLKSWQSSLVSAWHLQLILSVWIIAFPISQVQEAMKLESQRGHGNQTHQAS